MSAYAPNNVNSPAFQKLINQAAASGQPIYFPAAPMGLGYNIAGTFNVPGPIIIKGDGYVHNVGSMNGVSFNAINYPLLVPAFTGSVLKPASNGLDVFFSNATGISVQFLDIAFEYQTPFQGAAGHLFNFTPPLISGTYGNDIGMSYSRFCNVGVFGHGGNSYVFNITNAIQNYYENLRTYGGGVWNVVNNNGATGSFGNSTICDSYGVLFCGGSAHGGQFVTNTAGLTSPGNLNAHTFIRTQINGLTYTGQYPVPPSTPTAAQYLFLEDALGIHRRFISADFESTQGNLIKLGGPRNNTNYNQIDDDSSNTSAGLQLTSTPVASSAFGDGTRIKGGVITTSGATSGSVVFPVSFSFGLYCVVLTPVESSALSAWLTGTPSNTGFSWGCASGTASIHWLAYGMY